MDLLEEQGVLTAPLRMLIACIIFAVFLSPATLVHFVLWQSGLVHLHWAYTLVVTALVGASFWIYPQSSHRPASDKSNSSAFVVGYFGLLIVITFVAVLTGVVLAFAGATTALLFALAYAAIEIGLVRRFSLSPGLILGPLLLHRRKAAKKVAAGIETVAAWPRTKATTAA
jgi:hypothetical protein